MNYMLYKVFRFHEILETAKDNETVKIDIMFMILKNDCLKFKFLNQVYTTNYFIAPAF